MIGQGREASKEFLRINASMATEIEQMIRAKAGLLGASAEIPTNGTALSAGQVDSNDLALDV